jgi:hypothetical protein
VFLKENSNGIPSRTVYISYLQRQKVESKVIPVNKPWRPTELLDVEVPTFSRQSPHRWLPGRQPYALAALPPQEDS